MYKCPPEKGTNSSGTNMKKEKEIRSIANVTTGESRVIEGSIPYNSTSQYLGFYEQLDPRCFEKTIRESKDIKVFYQHEENRPLARTKNGSLRLENTPTELRFSFDVPETTDGNDLLTLVRDGIIDSCSFGMVVVNDRWEIKEGVEVRTVIEAKLFEISPVTNPAYEESNVHVRSLSEALKEKDNLDEADRTAIQNEINELSSLLPKEEEPASASKEKSEPEQLATDQATTSNKEEEKQLQSLSERLDKVSEILNRGMNNGH